jgi:hypothetical protein
MSDYSKLYQAAYQKNYQPKYYIENRQTILKLNKEYYSINKDDILLYKKIKHNCPCGGRYTNSGKSIHMKSIKHRKYISSL